MVNGSVNSLKSIHTENKTKIVAAINNLVRLFELTKTNALEPESPYSGNIVSLYLDVSKNGFILVGDLMRSISGTA